MLRFSHIHRSVTFYSKITKFAVELAAYKGSKNWTKLRQVFPRCERPKFQFLFLVFFLLLFAQHKNRFNSEMHASIGLKFSERVGQPKAIISTKFCEDPTKILVVINDYSRKQRLICWPAYRVNRWLDWLENWYIAGFNIKEPFGG